MYFLLLVAYSTTGGQTQGKAKLILILDYSCTNNNNYYWYAGLTVSITTLPASEPYPAAQWISFNCTVTGNTSMVVYDWVLLCSNQQPPLVVQTFENNTNVSQFDIRIRSTPSTCLDTVMCNAMDQSGNSGHATWTIGRVTGEQVYYDRHSKLFAHTDPTRMVAEGPGGYPYRAGSCRGVHCSGDCNLIRAATHKGGIV